MYPNNFSIDRLAYHLPLLTIQITDIGTLNGTNQPGFHPTLPI
jgi:hypothetical protein